jgi:maleamate amidohydrolase
MKFPWEDLIPPHELALYRSAGFGKRLGFGKRPALLIIDVQYRTVGYMPQPIEQAIKEYPTSCGHYGWNSVANIQRLLALFRDKGLPIIYPHVAPKNRSNGGRFAEKAPSIMAIDEGGYYFVKEVEPKEGDILLPKNHPSAFFGTPLTSYLVDHGVDSVVVTGCTTSGCVRATVIDAFSYNFRAIVPHECVYDRSQVSHRINLFDIASKYADVVETGDAMQLVAAL